MKFKMTIIHNISVILDFSMAVQQPFHSPQENEPIGEHL